jgi:hypothetical protein|tara:strand:+ start:542 stop:850 length:309 start_codon:yes stop_codon:yes gene_type:complete
MKEFFESLNQLPKIEPKKHFATVEGKQYEVSLEIKLKMIQHGEENFIVKQTEKGPEFVLKQIAKPKIGYRMLQKAETGYDFYDNNPYYPRNQVKGGWWWEYE